MLKLKRVHVEGLATIFQTIRREGKDNTTGTIHRNRGSNIRDFSETSLSEMINKVRSHRQTDKQRNIL